MFDRLSELENWYNIGVAHQKNKETIVFKKSTL